MTNNISALIFDIEDLAVKDGKGLRTVVFFKGCPLNCLWCSNPESQSFSQEIMYFSSLCKKCLQCIKFCPHKAISRGQDNNPVFQRAICSSCTEKYCFNYCLKRAIKVAGKSWTPEELYNRVKKNSLFYRNSGGGITLSGGEPFFYSEFIKEFLQISQKTGLSVGVETSGFFDWNKVKSFVEYFDFYYFDLKSIDNDIHKKCTGKGNDLILENLSHLAEINPDKIILSIPVIPEINAFPGTFETAGELCGKLGIKRVRLLPYHSLGRSKYEALGRDYLLQDIGELMTSEMKDFLNIIKNKKLECSIE